MEAVLGAPQKLVHNTVDRYKLWKEIIDHWHLIIQSDISIWAGFDLIQASSLFESWLCGRKGDGVVENDFLRQKLMLATADRLVYHLYEVILEILDKKTFVRLFHPSTFLCEDTLYDAILYERQKTLG